MEERDMCFSEKISHFMEASVNVLRGNTNYPKSDLLFDLGEVSLKTMGDDRRSMRGDVMHLGGDFKKSTRLAKNKLNNGKTASTK